MSSIVKAICCCNPAPLVNCAAWHPDTGDCASSYAFSWTGLIWRALRRDGSGPNYFPAQYIEWSQSLSGTLTRSHGFLFGVPFVAYSGSCASTLSHLDNTADAPAGSCCKTTTIDSDFLDDVGIGITCYAPTGEERYLIPGSNEGIVNYTGPPLCPFPTCVFASPGFAPFGWWSTGPPFDPEAEQKWYAARSLDGCLPGLPMEELATRILSRLLHLRPSTWPSSNVVPLININPGSISIT